MEQQAEFDPATKDWNRRQYHEAEGTITGWALLLKIHLLQLKYILLGHLVPSIVYYTISFSYWIIFNLYFF